MKQNHVIISRTTEMIFHVFEQEVFNFQMHLKIGGQMNNMNKLIMSQKCNNLPVV